MGRKTITLPKKYWDRLYSLANEIDGNISDAVFMVVDIGFEALGNEKVMYLLSEEEDKGDKDAEEEEEDREEEDDEEEEEEEGEEE